MKKAKEVKKMIAIKDMNEMPECCAKCRFECAEGDYDFYYCSADPNRLIWRENEIIDDMERERGRMIWCPLVEVKEKTDETVCSKK